MATVNSNVGTYGSATQVSVVTVNAKGLVTAASSVPISLPFTSITGSLAASQLPAFTGDVTSPAGSSVNTLANSGVTAGTYNNSATSVTPITVNAKGLVTGTGTAVTIAPAFTSLTGSLAASQLPAFTGDVTTSAGSSATTLATVNTNIGSFGSATQVASVTVNAKGLITGVSSVPIVLPLSSLSGTLSGSQLPALTGDVTSTAGSNVTTLAIVNTTPCVVNDDATTITPITVNAKGLVTSIGSAVTITPDFSSLTGTISLAQLQTVNSNTGTFGSATTSAIITVNAQGLVTSASGVTITPNFSNLVGSLEVSQLPALTGDVISTAGSNSVSLLASGVTAGTYKSVTVNSKGVVTLGANPTTILGYGITDAVNSNLLGAANGVATLDSTGKLTAAQMPSALTGAVVYIGTWDANTNTPTLSSGSGVKGNYYVVSTAGSTTVDGINSWTPSDVIIFNGTTWDKIDGQSSEVLSVAGRTGNVVIVSTDISDLAPSATVDTTNASNIINGTLNAAQLPAFTGDATSVAGTSELTLAVSGVTAGTYNNSATSVTPITVNGKGLVTSTGTAVIITPAFSSLTGSLAASQLPAFTGDVNTSAGSSATTLATVNSNVGTFGSGTAAPVLTVNAKGLITAVSTTPITNAWSSITSIPSNVTEIAGLSDTETGNIVFTNGVATIDSTSYAPLNSPVFTGTPTAPTPVTGDNSTNIATTEYVQALATSLSTTLAGSLSSVPWTSVTGKPTTVAGYGITDAVSNSSLTSTLSGYATNASIALLTVEDLDNVQVTSPSNGQVLAWNSTDNKWENANASISTVDWSNVTSQPTLLTGYNITSADPLLSVLAPLNSPALYGTPTAPTVATTDSSTTLATTAFVQSVVSAIPGATIESLADVSVTSISNGQVLAWNSSTLTWVNSSLPTTIAFTNVTGTPATLAGYGITDGVTSSSLTSILSGYAHLASPAFTGTPTATTASLGTSNTQLATTAFVQNAVSSMTFSALLGKPNTIAGYGITDAISASDLATALGGYATTASITALTLENLADINVSAPSDGQALV